MGWNYAKFFARVFSLSPLILRMVTIVNLALAMEKLNSRQKK